MTEEEVRSIVRETVHETLEHLGVEYEKPLEMQEDFAFMRAWRQSADKVRERGISTAVGVLITGAIALLWLGVQKVLEH